LQIKNGIKFFDSPPVSKVDYERRQMSQFWVFIIGMFAGGTVVLIYLRYPQRHTNKLENVGVLAETEEERKIGLIEMQAREKAENKSKILDYFKTHEKVSNNDVENALGVSDATATRYLDELEKEGKIRQVGKIGTGVYYELSET